MSHVSALILSGYLSAALADAGLCLSSCASWYHAIVGTTGKSTALYSGELSVTAAPEPETCAMLLAGLGAIGFIARRRRAQA